MSDSESSSGSEGALEVSAPYPLFALVASGGKAASFEVPLGWVLHVTGATLGKDAQEGERVLVAVATSDGNNGVICSLREGGQEHVTLNLNLLPSPEDLEIRFQTDSAASVHLSGYLEPVDVGLDDDSDDEFDFEDDEEIDSDEAGGDDSDAMSPEMLVTGSDSEDEEEQARSPQKKKGQKKLVADKDLLKLVAAVKANGAADISSDEGDSFDEDADSSDDEEEAPKATPIKKAAKKKRAAEEAAEERPAKKSKKELQKEAAAAKAKAKAEEAAKAMAAAKEEEKRQRAEEKKKAKAEKKKKEAEKAKAKAQAPKIVKAGNGLEYQDVRVGDGAVVKNGKRLRMRYNGTLTNGKKFDGNMPRGQPFTFRLGAGEVIKGWDLGIKGMRVGGLRKIRIPPHLGYGRQRSGPIPPNSTLLFDVEVLACQ